MSAPAQKTEGPPAADPEAGRVIGLVGATGVGIGAIVGGGILVLAGVAFRATGPAAVVAFGLNGIIAILTALAFAEMSTAFPESGGAYTFAKKVLNVRAAFAMGWILWFAYIVAGVLYALGFASYAIELMKTLWELSGSSPPAWLGERSAFVAAALVPTVFYTVSLIRQASGGGELATWGKVVVFVVIIAAGMWALLSADGPSVERALTPFFSNGFGGLIQALGFTFIALQGFDLIAAIAGEVKQPRRTIPRAMLLSLGAALAIYLPLLFLVSSVGVSPGESIGQMSERAPETVMADAVGNFMGRAGYWLVMIAALLSTLSALQANLLAASRVALSMAQDRTLPAILGQRHATRNTPMVAVYTSALALVTILLIVPDLAAAGAAASLIFLIAFALAHWTSYLARKRSGERLSMLPSAPPETLSQPAEEPFRAPLFPLVPVVGGLLCGVLAIMQGIAVPAAGGITMVWLGLGVVLYLALFSSRAKVLDAFAEAHDPTLLRMRGRRPLVLVPVANPASAPAMVAMAAALAPPKVGRVVLMSVMRPPADGAQTAQTVDPTQDAPALVRRALLESLAAGHRPEALITIADAPWREIRRVAELYDIEGLLLGLGEVDEAARQNLEKLLNDVDCDVSFFRSSAGCSVSEARRILVPIGGRGGHVAQRARLLGSLQRTAPREVTWLSVVPPTAGEGERRRLQRSLNNFSEDKSSGDSRTALIESSHPSEAIIEHAKDFDLLVLGIQTAADGRRVFGDFALEVARRAPCAVILISQRSHRRASLLSRSELPERAEST